MQQCQKWPLLETFKDKLKRIASLVVFCQNWIHDARVQAQVDHPTLFKGVPNAIARPARNIG